MTFSSAAILNPDGRINSESARLALMARRPEFGEEKIWTREELKEIAHNLALLSVQGVRDFYDRAYRECRLSGRDFPPARAVQELVQAWKLLRKWRKRG
jgi:hypothetical protein